MLVEGLLHQEYLYKIKPDFSRTVDTYICLSGGLTGAAKVNEPLNVILYNNNSNTSVNSGAIFTYKDDPLIFSIKPLTAIET